MKAPFFPKVLRAMLCIVASTYALGAYAQHSAEATDPHGKKVRVHFDAKLGTARSISGFSEHIRGYGLAHEDLSRASIRELGKKLFDDYSRILGFSSRNLREKGISHAGAMWSASYTQVVNNVPVEGSHAGFDIGRWGDILHLNMKWYPNVTVETTPSLSASRALEIAKRYYSGGDTIPGIGAHELVILPEEVNGQFVYHLAWKLILEGGSSAMRLYISARDGALLREQGNQVEETPHAQRYILCSGFCVCGDSAPPYICMMQYE